MVHKEGGRLQHGNMGMTASSGPALPHHPSSGPPLRVPVPRPSCIPCLAPRWSVHWLAGCVPSPCPPLGGHQARARPSTTGVTSALQESQTGKHDESTRVFTLVRWCGEATWYPSNILTRHFKPLSCSEHDSLQLKNKVYDVPMNRY